MVVNLLEKDVKYIKLDIVNVIVIVSTIIAFGILFGGYLYWTFLVPSNTWALVVKENTELHALNLQNGNSIMLDESEEDWTPNVHLAMSGSLANKLKQVRYSGRWNGGAAILLSDSQEVIFVLRKEDIWQVNLIDLKTGVLQTLVESLEAEPFISIAPIHRLTAISLPATEEEPARLRAFSGAEEKNIPVEVNDKALTVKGLISPDGEKILYSATIRNTNKLTSTVNHYQTSLHVTNLDNKKTHTIYEFEHRNSQNSTRYSFTSDSQAVIYETPEMLLKRSDIEGITTSIFTPTENISIVNWNITPDSNHAILLLKKEDNNEVGSLHIISFDTGENIPLTEEFQLDRISYAFLNSEQMLYSPSPDKLVIYNINMNEKNTISNSEANFTLPPLISRDMDLVALVSHNTTGTNLNFYNLFEKNLIQNLDFEIPSRNDKNAKAIELATKYILFEQDESLYYKDISSSTSSMSIVTDYDELHTAFFTDDPNYVLYDTTVNEQTNIYLHHINSQNQQKEPFLKNAQLLHLFRNEH